MLRWVNHCLILHTHSPLKHDGKFALCLACPLQQNLLHLHIEARPCISLPEHVLAAKALVLQPPQVGVDCRQLQPRLRAL